MVRVYMYAALLQNPRTGECKLASGYQTALSLADATKIVVAQYEAQFPASSGWTPGQFSWTDLPIDVMVSILKQNSAFISGIQGV